MCLKQACRNHRFGFLLIWIPRFLILSKLLKPPTLKDNINGCSDLILISVWPPVGLGSRLLTLSLLVEVSSCLKRVFPHHCWCMHAKHKQMSNVATCSAGWNKSFKSVTRCNQLGFLKWKTFNQSVWIIRLNCLCKNPWDDVLEIVVLQINRI